MWHAVAACLSISNVTCLSSIKGKAGMAVWLWKKRKENEREEICGTWASSKQDKWHGWHSWQQYQNNSSSWAKTSWGVVGQMNEKAGISDRMVRQWCGGTCLFGTVWLMAWRENICLARGGTGTLLLLPPLSITFCLSLYILIYTHHALWSYQSLCGTVCVVGWWHATWPL